MSIKPLAIDATTNLKAEASSSSLGYSASGIYVGNGSGMTQIIPAAGESIRSTPNGQSMETFTALDKDKYEQQRWIDRRNEQIILKATNNPVVQNRLRLYVLEQGDGFVLG